LAEELHPAHKAACHRLAKIVELLNTAIEEERAVRSKLAELGWAHILPDASKEFGVLGEFHSVLSSWNR
jgi:hypothetical protein